LEEVMDCKSAKNEVKNWHVQNAFPCCLQCRRQLWFMYER